MSESNQRPTDYKSVALPAELKWHIFSGEPAKSPLYHLTILKKWQIIQLQRAKPKIFWKAKVTEFANWQKISKNILEFSTKKDP